MIGRLSEVERSVVGREKGGTRTHLKGARGLLTVIGAINWDVSIFEDSFARLGEEVPVREVEEYSGGKGANVAVAAARVLGPGKAAFVGALGDDEVAKVQLRQLKQEGVVTDGVVRVEGSRSGRAYVIVNKEGKKSIHTHFGANALIRPEHLSGSGPASVLSRASMLVVMDPPRAVALAAVETARESGALVSYSPGVRVREGRVSLSDIIDQVDFLVLDRSELVRLSGTRDAARAIEFMNKARPAMTVVATSGKGGCVVAGKGKTTRLAGVDLSSLGMKAVNSTGSGDAFLGVLASYLCSGMGAAESAKWANLAGALKATRYETRGSPILATLRETMERLEGLAGHGGTRPS